VLLATAAPTTAGHARLQARCHQFALQLERVKVCPSGDFDAHGNPVPHPQTPAGDMATNAPVAASLSA